MIQKIILNRLLDKYEKSVHLREPGSSNRRVMLRINYKELPEYEYESADVRDEYNEAAKLLERQDLVSIEWVSGRPVISAIILKLEKILDAYTKTGREHPKQTAREIHEKISRALNGVDCGWILDWKNDVCDRLINQWKIPGVCKQQAHLDALLKAMVNYGALNGEYITMRAFSSLCFKDSKYFERKIRDDFLKIAVKYCSELAEACENDELSVREKLAVLGIYARPELYEIAGSLVIVTAKGEISLAPLSETGLAIPSTAIDSIIDFRLDGVKKIFFIENKTNYDEFLLSGIAFGQAVIYHGGFFSPQKKKFIAKIARSVPEEAEVFFWGDIDLGGFQMFERLQKIISSIKPYRMSETEVEKYADTGLARNADYLERLSLALRQNKFPIFGAAIEMILNCGVTIEQEALLNNPSQMHLNF